MRKLIFIFSIILLTSCATKQVMLKEPVIIEHVTHDTLKKTRFVNTSDTVYVRDSIAPNDRGGTDRWHTEWHGSKRTTTDTVYIHHTDTIPKPVYITKTVTVREKQSLRERAFVFLTVAVIFVVAGWVIFKSRD